MNKELFTILLLAIIAFPIATYFVIQGKMCPIIYDDFVPLPEVITEYEECEEVECPKYVRIEKVNCGQDKEIERLNNYINNSCYNFGN